MNYDSCHSHGTHVKSILSSELFIKRKINISLGSLRLKTLSQCLFKELLLKHKNDTKDKKFTIIKTSGYCMLDFPG